MNKDQRIASVRVSFGQPKKHFIRNQINLLGLFKLGLIQERGLRQIDRWRGFYEYRLAVFLIE